MTIFILVTSRSRLKKSPSSSPSDWMFLIPLMSSVLYIGRVR